MEKGEPRSRLCNYLINSMSGEISPGDGFKSLPHLDHSISTVLLCSASALLCSTHLYLYFNPSCQRTYTELGISTFYAVFHPSYPLCYPSPGLSVHLLIYSYLIQVHYHLAEKKGAGAGYHDSGTEIVVPILVLDLRSGIANHPTCINNVEMVLTH